MSPRSIQYVVAGSCALVASLFCVVAEAQVTEIPIEEVTVFKDGHAFVLHEGEAVTDARGNVVLDRLPVPVVGTFWAYSNEPGASLTGVTARRNLVDVPRAALTISDLIEGNQGARVRVRETSGAEYVAEILDLPVRSHGEADASTVAAAGSIPPEQRGEIVLLKVDEGVRAVPLHVIEQLLFDDPPTQDINRREYRNRMTLKFDWDNGKPADQARVGMVYLQRGLRWIPSYRLDIDGKGSARVQLQATIINELVDLSETTMHLVVGAPQFTFAEMPDPISLETAVARLSNTFRSNSQTAQAFSNIMTQQLAMAVVHPEFSERGAELDLGPDIGEARAQEDLFIFTLENLTLAKGERTVVPVAEFEISYRDVFVLDLPFGPPAEVQAQFGNDRNREYRRLLSAPRVRHVLRLDNSSNSPLTTAPAMILKQNRLIAQSMMTYTAIGASSDLEVTAAMDVTGTAVDAETGRSPNSLEARGYTLDRIDLEGAIQVANHRATPVTMEIRRWVLGHVDSADSEGSVKHTGWQSGGALFSGELPMWWGWYGWPSWWYHANPVGRIDWTMTLAPNETTELGYTWHYFWD